MKDKPSLATQFKKQTGKLARDFDYSTHVPIIKWTNDYVEWLESKLSEKAQDVKTVCREFIALLNDAKNNYDDNDGKFISSEVYYKQTDKVAETAKKLLEGIG